MTQSIDIIKGGLRRITSYQSGEPLNAIDAQDALDTLNDLLDSLSTDKLHIFGSNENILQWTAGKNDYTLGNPSNSDLGYPNIVGTITGNTITVVSVPVQLVAGSSVLNASTVTDLQGLIPAGTYVTATTPKTITLSQNVTSPSNGNDVVSWTVPGDFGIARPLRITHGFTRFNALDFTLDVAETQDQYTSILYKAQPGPWPTVAWYNPTMPYGHLKVYQTPGNNATLYLYTDTILSRLTLYQTVLLPQGYSRALKWLLARELWAEYVDPGSVPAMVDKLASESLNLLKALNARPAQVSRYERALLRGNRPDGGWITHGGYR